MEQGPRCAARGRGNAIASDRARVQLTDPGWAAARFQHVPSHATCTLSRRGGVFFPPLVAPPHKRGTLYPPHVASSSSFQPPARYPSTYPSHNPRRRPLSNCHIARRRISTHE